VDIVPAQASDIPTIAGLWNRSIGDLPLRARVLEQFWQNPYFDSELALVARDDSSILGAIAGKAPSSSWSNPEAAYLSYLVVAPKARRQGIGRALYEALAGRLKAKGRTHVHFGSDPGHLLPGVPTGASLDTWRFLRRLGMRFTSAHHDLHLDLRLELPEPKLTLEFGGADGEEVLEFLDRAFPGRWREEVEGYLLKGAPVLTLSKENRVVGFAAVFLPNGPLIGPSQFWSPALEGAVAGLGPMGVDASLRGQGQGLALFIAAARWLKNLGAEHLLIDWTSLSGFYGRAGAHLWRTYQYVEGDLA
jgi:predicted N-acetyltransferase YhbS